MKDIEKVMKEALENHELPYDATMWNAVSKRLDGTPATPSYRKWWVAASVGTALIGTAIYFAIQQKPSHHTPEQKTELVQNETTAQATENTPDTKQQKAIAQNNAVSNPSTPEVTPSITQQTQSKTTDNTSATKPVINHNDNKITTEVHSQASKQGEENVLYEQVFPKGNTEYSIVLKKTNYCVGDNIDIENPNSIKMLVAWNGKTESIAPNGKKRFTPTADGTMEVSVGTKKQTIRVQKASSNLYIDVDPTLMYSNGIPSIEFTVSGNDNNVQWKVEKHPSEQKNETLIVHPYKGQEITVTATTKDDNGCVATETKTVTLNERYNLQAATGFRPNSGDSRTNTFMPYALKERNVSFELTIFDAKSGLELFRSNDAALGWNGKTKSGDELSAGTTALWKVIIHNPNPGEPAEYKGQITITE